MDGCFVWCTHGSILGPLLFNIFLCDIFHFCKDADFASCADNAPYCIGKKNPEEVISQRNLQYPFLNGLKIME